MGKFYPKDLRSILKLISIPFGLILFASGNWFFRTFMTNFDERDHLAAGFLMSKGLILYRDIFSHHFPFPYYWVNFWNFLWVDQAPYRGIAMFRTTLNIYYILCCLLVFVCLIKYKNKLTFVLFLVSTVLLMPLFHGNVLLSETFGFFPVLMIIWLMFSSFAGDLKNNNLTALICSMLCGFAFWSQPLLIFVFLLPLYFLKKKLTFIFSSFLVLSIPLLAFIFNGSIVDFYNMGIWFNSQIYSKYYSDIEGIEPGFMGLFKKTISNQYVMMFKPDFNNPILTSQFIGSWVFAIVTTVLIMMKRVKYLILFLISVMLVRVREVKVYPGEIFDFGLLPYMMFINLTFFALIYTLKNILKVFSIFVLFLYLFFIGQAAMPIIRQSLIGGYNYHVFWSDRQAAGDEIAKLTDTNDPILIYPNDVDLYYFAKRLPPDKFLYWFPWINDVASYKKERSTSIEKKMAKVIYLGNMSIDMQPNYYGKIWPKLLDGYKQATSEGKFSHIYIRL